MQITITIITSGALIALSLVIQLIKLPPQTKNIILMAFVIIIGSMSAYSELKSSNANIGIHPAKFSTPPLFKAPSWNNYQNLTQLNLPKGFTYLLLYGTKSQGKSTFAKQIVKSVLEFEIHNQAIDSSQPALYVDIIIPIKSVQDGLEQIFGTPALSSITQQLQQYNANKQIPLLVLDHIERGITSECYFCASIIQIDKLQVFTLLHEASQIKIIMISDQVSLAQQQIISLSIHSGKYANSMVELNQFQLPNITQPVEIFTKKIIEIEPLNSNFKFEWLQNSLKQELNYSVKDYLIQERTNLLTVWKEDTVVTRIIKSVYDIMCSSQKENECENQFIHFGLIKKMFFKSRLFIDFSPDFDLNTFYRCLNENWIFSYQGQLKFFDHFIFESAKNL